MPFKSFTSKADKAPAKATNPAGDKAKGARRPIAEKEPNQKVREGHEIGMKESSC